MHCHICYSDNEVHMSGPMARLLGTGVVVALSYLLLCNEVHMSGPMARLLGTGVVVALSYLLL